MMHRIMMNVQMNCQKSRAEVLKLVAKEDGVSFVGLEGPENERVVVIGDGVDAVKLASRLRKKVGYAALLSVGLLDDLVIQDDLIGWNSDNLGEWNPSESDSSEE